MSIPIEALAMAGANYLEYGMDIEEWESQDLEPPPAHLLANDDDEEVRSENKCGFPTTFFLHNDSQNSSRYYSSSEEDAADDDLVAAGRHQRAGRMGVIMDRHLRSIHDKSHNKAKHIWTLKRDSRPYSPH